MGEHISNGVPDILPGYHHEEHKNTKGSYWEEEKITFRGRVVSVQSAEARSIIEGGIFGRPKEIPITVITFISETQERPFSAWFPREFSEPEADALKDQEVGYVFVRSLFSEGSLGDLVGEKHTLYLLSGPQLGWSVEGKITI